MPDKEDLLLEGALQISENTPQSTVRAPNMPTVYVNNIGFGVSAVEVRLFLGEILPNPDGKSVTITQRLAVVMTPEYAKVVAETLLQAITNLEKQFGPLRNIRPEKRPSTQST
jgi:hypothetical protein